MKSKKFDNREEWDEARKGKITGSKLKDIVVKRGTGEKIGFYELIAERIAEQADEENPMERGTRLEDEAIQKFSTLIKKEIDTSLVIWEREDNKDIAISPDGFFENTAVEIKCLSSARHIEAYLTKKVPDEYEYQKLQYFVVNEELKNLYFVFYDPRMPEHLQLHYIEIKREDVEEEVKELVEYQKGKLQTINEIIQQLTF